MIKKIIISSLLLTTLSSNLLAKEEKKITITQMEIHLATLAKEIAEEKVKLFQKEALLQDAKLALLKEKEAQKVK
ncbi:MAG: Unknown protein [uncultured Sulfurovum sp.]|uniref:Uncharacterized protein n=1 Tax=uncultured Sulfurovum sp. TaxID=269237 RepID=A0A6S6S8N5_9BACT|nr:MAG: Unknown protein [uncultured Sulfurovum sp.]